MNLLNYFLPLSTTTLFAVAPSATLVDDKKVVANRVQAFRQAQFDQDDKALDALCADELSYSHSDGHVEDKATFLFKATNGRYAYDVLENLNTVISVVGSAAIVRFNWVARQTWKEGRVTETNLAILMVWQKTGNAWTLLARSATRL